MKEGMKATMQADPKPKVTNPSVVLLQEALGESVMDHFKPETFKLGATGECGVNWIPYTERTAHIRGYRTYSQKLDLLQLFVSNGVLFDLHGVTWFIHKIDFEVEHNSVVVVNVEFKEAYNEERSELRRLKTEMNEIHHELSRITGYATDSTNWRALLRGVDSKIKQLETKRTSAMNRHEADKIEALATRLYLSRIGSNKIFVSGEYKTPVAMSDCVDEAVCMLDTLKHKIPSILEAKNKVD